MENAAGKEIGVTLVDRNLLNSSADAVFAHLPLPAQTMNCKHPSSGVSGDCGRWADAAGSNSTTWFAWTSGMQNLGRCWRM